MPYDLRYLHRHAPPGIDSWAIERTFEDWSLRSRPVADTQEFYIEARRTTESERASLTEKDRRRGLPARTSRLEEELNLRSADMLRSLLPTIEGIRRATFDKAEAPFATLAKAAAWIEAHTVDREPDFLGGNLAAMEWQSDLEDQIQAKAHPLRPYRTFEVRSRLHLLSYFSQAGDLRHRLANRQEWPKVVALHRNVERLSEETMIPSASVLAYVLTGKAPGESVSLPSGKQGIIPGMPDAKIVHRTVGGPLGLKHERVTIDMAAQDVTDIKLRAVRQRIAGAVAERKAKAEHARNYQHRRKSGQRSPLEPQPRTDKQREVSRAIAKFGRPEESHRWGKVYWEKVARSMSRPKAEWLNYARTYWRMMGRKV